MDKKRLAEKLLELARQAQAVENDHYPWGSLLLRTEIFSLL